MFKPFFDRIATFITSKIPQRLRYRATIVLGNGQILRDAIIEGPVTIVANSVGSGAVHCIFTNDARLYLRSSD